MNRFLFIVFFIIFISLAIPLSAIANAVKIKALSIRNGLESQISLSYPLDDKKQVYGSKYFKSKDKLAKKAGIELKKFMNKSAVAGFNPTNNNFFLLFYNTVKSINCSRDYLVQRVKITKSFYNDKGSKYKKSHEYLVEVMKTKKRSWKRADQHYKSYSLNKASKRSVVVDIEVGCGVIPNKATGRKWPYRKGILYKKVQDYSYSPGYYDDIVFDSSTKYSFSFEFSKDGIHTIDWPYFIK